MAQPPSMSGPPMPPGAPRMPPMPAPMMPPAGAPLPPGAIARAAGAPLMPKPGAAAAPGENPDEEPLAPQLPFMQQPWVQNVLPLVTSLVVHAMIVVLGVMFAVVVVKQSQKIKEEQQLIIAESAIADAGPPGGIPNMGVNDDPMHKAMQDQNPDAATADGFASKESPKVDANAGGSAGDGEASSAITLGAGSLGGKGGSGAGGTGSGSGPGSGDGGGPLAQFGAPGGGARGPQGPVFGHGGNARQIVFICDATGTMLNKFATLKSELRKTIDGLKPFQSFNVIFYFDGGKVGAANEGTLMVANPENKRKTFKFLDDFTVQGTTDPIPAIAKAFQQQPAPQMVYFLSDGEFNNLRSYKEVQDEFAKHNPDKKIRVNTILFETFDKEAADVMNKIATDSGGKYVYVQESDISN